MNNNTNKELSNIKNKIEVIESKMTSNEREYRLTKDKMANKLFLRNTALFSLLIIFLFANILTLKSVEYIASINYRGLALADIILFSLGSIITSSAIKLGIDLKNLKQDFEEEMDLLSKLRQDSYDKLNEFKKINNEEIVKVNDVEKKEILVELKQELISLKEEQKEKEKVKTIGSIK
jgi:hypothetical protein